MVVVVPRSCTVRFGQRSFRSSVPSVWNDLPYGVLNLALSDGFLSVTTRNIYHIVVHKRQNRLEVGTDKPKLKVKMQSVSDDDVRKRLLEKPRSEMAAKGVFRLERCYIFWQGVPGLRASN